MASKMIHRWLSKNHVGRGSRRLLAASIGATLAVSVLAGCASTGTKELFWPPPPLKPRIKFVRTLMNEESLGVNAGEAFLRALAGTKKQVISLTHPLALYPARDGSRLYVSDHHRGVVFVFDFQKESVSFLRDEVHGMKRPFGVGGDEQGNIYVADSALKLIRVFDKEGKLVRDITDESLERPTGLAVDAKRGRIYMADGSFRKSQNHLVHVFDLEGKHIKKFGGKGTTDGKFYFPTYVTVGKDGNVYVTDTMNARIQEFDANGKFLRRLGSRGDSFGAFDKPKGVALDTFGNIYVVDSTFSNVQIFNQKKDVLLYFAGRGGNPGLLDGPNGIAIDGENNIYIADTFNRRVSVYKLINTTAEDSFLPPPKPQTIKKGGKSKEITEKESKESS